MLGTHYQTITIRKGDVTMTGAEFRTWRRKHEISQQTVADNVDCNKSTISRWEKGELHLVPDLYKKVIIYYETVENVIPL